MCCVLCMACVPCSVPVCFEVTLSWRLTSTPTPSSSRSKMARCIGGAYAAAHDGLFVPGGSIANLYGLLLARHAKFPSSRDEGLAGLPRMAVFCSEQAHFSVRKCAAVAGLGMASVVPVPCDARGRMRPDALRAKIREVSERGE